jgi:hypothetical protein
MAFDKAYEEGNMKKITDDTKTPKLTGKQRKFLNLYLDYDNPKTFFNALACTRIVSSSDNPGTLRKQSYQFTEKTRIHIDYWIENSALSDEALKSKLYSLMNAKQTKFFAYQGKIVDQREVEALDIQIRAASLVSEIKGLKKSPANPVKVEFYMDFGTPPPPVYDAD